MKLKLLLLSDVNAEDRKRYVSIIARMAFEEWPMASIGTIPMLESGRRKFFSGLVHAVPESIGIVINDTDNASPEVIGYTAMYPLKTEVGTKHLSGTFNQYELEGDDLEPRKTQVVTHLYVQAIFLDPQYRKSSEHLVQLKQLIYSHLRVFKRRMKIDGVVFAEMYNKKLKETLLNNYGFTTGKVKSFGKHEIATINYHQLVK